MSKWRFRRGTSGRELGSSRSCPRTACRRGQVGAGLLDEIGARPEDVLLSVVGVPAPVDVNAQSPTGDRGFWAGMNPGFADVLPGRVVVENDANLAAIAEHARLLKDDGVGSGDDNPSGSSGDSGRDGAIGNVATLSSGERLGAGLIVDGRLLRGARGGAGELRALDLIGDAGSCSRLRGACAPMGPGNGCGAPGRSES